jgi:hypothetical protein
VPNLAPSLAPSLLVKNLSFKPMLCHDHLSLSLSLLLYLSLYVGIYSLPTFLPPASIPTNLPVSLSASLPFLLLQNPPADTESYQLGYFKAYFSPLRCVFLPRSYLTWQDYEVSFFRVRLCLMLWYHFKTLVMSKLVKFLSFAIQLELCSDRFPGRLR